MIPSYNAVAAANDDNPFAVSTDEYGNLKITADAKTASSGIRWRSIGFNVSTSPIESETILGKQLSELEGETLYFNTIFEVYQIVDGKEVIINGHVNDWKDIVNNQGWHLPAHAT